MKKNKLVKLIFLALLLIGLMFLISFLHFLFEYYKSYPIPSNEVRNYELSVNESGERILLLKNDSPHSMLQFQGANANYVDENLYLKLKYCSKPSLLCNLDIVNPIYSSATQIYSLALPDSTGKIYLDFGKGRVVEVPQADLKPPSP